MRLAIPRPPFGPDPLRRISIPDDLDAVTDIGDEVDPTDVGMTRDDVERIWTGVRGFYRSGVHPAIQLTLRRHGAVVLDRAIGHARGNGPGDDPSETPVPVTTDTPFVIYSAAKAVTATLVHLLDERGELHVGDRVVDYLPEYGRHGKQTITLAHILSHRAGVPNLPREVFDLDVLEDPARILDVICDTKPVSRPGKSLAYHAISGGFILQAILERVTGKPLRRLLADEILDPLGFRWGNYGVEAEDVPLVGRCYATGFPVLPPLSTLLTRALGVPVGEIIAKSNDPRFLQATIPAANVITSANELGRFFELLRAGGTLDGVEILHPRTIRRATVEHSYRELDLTLGFPTRYSLGFMLGAQVLSLYGPDTEETFGHLGFSNVLGWADPARALSGALVTSGKPIVYPELPQLLALMARIGRHTGRV